MSNDITSTAGTGLNIDKKRIVFIFIGLGLFFLFYLLPEFAPAVDPLGKEFPLPREGQVAIGLFLLAATFWVFEVIPIGVTSILIGVMQALFRVRDTRVAFTDFMDTSVWFIFGSIVIGMVFTKTGLTKRLAYKMLLIVGEKTSMIYLGCFVLTSSLTLIMAHTAVAATVFPLLATIYALYDEEEKPSKFGKGLFMGMAFVAGAGSIITLLGAARGAVALGFYREIVGQDISFFELSRFMFPLGALMTFLLWGFFMVFFKPEKASIPGLREKAGVLYSALGPMKKAEIFTITVVLGLVVILSARSFLSPEILSALPIELHKSAIILVATLLFFLFNILDIGDLEAIPWNIILLFGGAMSIGFCLWQTGAANWLAVMWLGLFENAPGFIFIMGITFFVLIMTNLIMNVAAIAISLPVALVIAPYLNVAPEVILFSALAAAGMPFLFLVGAAPNAIAYGSKQFTTGEFFIAGIPGSILVMIVVGLFVKFVWPIMGMHVFIN